MLDFSNVADTFLYAQTEALDADEDAFSEALGRDCPDVKQALNNPTHPKLDHIDSIAWVYAGEAQGMMEVNWRDKRIAVALRATSFAIAQVAAVRPTLGR